MRTKSKKKLCPLVGSWKLTSLYLRIAEEGTWEYHDTSYLVAPQIWEFQKTGGFRELLAQTVGIYTYCESLQKLHLCLPNQLWPLEMYRVEWVGTNKLILVQLEWGMDWDRYTLERIPTPSVRD